MRRMGRGGCRNPMEGKKVIFVEDARDGENADGARGHLEAVGDSAHEPGAYDRYVKRGLDAVLSLAGLVVLGPLLLGVAAAIRLDGPGPVLFTQERIGKGKKYFRLHKFRTMRTDAPHDVPTHMLGDPGEHVTRVGRFLRRTSIDELPQLWDVLVGEMSLVGPRPALWNQDVLVAERDRYGANDVRPGLTGWAQINGRDGLGIGEKARLDGEYVRRLGFLFDVRCLIGTVLPVVRGAGVAGGRSKGAAEGAAEPEVPEKGRAEGGRKEHGRRSGQDSGKGGPR